MTVYVYPADTYGCGHYRMIWPARALAAMGYDVKLIMPGEDRQIGGAFDTRAGRLTQVSYPEDATAIVLQRVAFANMAQAVSMMRAKGVAVIVDMDDDLTKIDPGNIAFLALRKDMGDRRHTYANAMQACLDATLVTVSTPQLLKVYAPHGRGVVLENRVPAGYLDVVHPDSPIVGWPGSVHSHPADLHVIGPAVARLVREGFEYFGVGPREGVASAFGLAERDVETTGALDMGAWPLGVTQLGVGLAPLADTLFNHAKSWLKPLEMSAVGVPWVASPRPEYARFAQLTGGGLIADKPRQWYAQIGRLLRDEGLRRELSAKGREAVSSPDWTYEGSAWRWAEAWDSAIRSV